MEEKKKLNGKKPTSSIEEEFKDVTKKEKDQGQLAPLENYVRVQIDYFLDTGKELYGRRM